MIPISKPFIGEAEKQAVLAVLDSGMLAQGPRTAMLEEKWAAICGTKHAIATSNGTAALHIALLAHGIGAGDDPVSRAQPVPAQGAERSETALHRTSQDEVITTPFTFAASANSILYTGARPVFVDIEPDTFNINPNLIEAAITPRTKAIMPVHLYGYPCEMDAIIDIARRHNLVIIEDAAQAIGADYKGRRAGSFGTGCFSLYATKNVMSGEGGMITTDDATFAQRCRLLRSHGMARRYYHDMLGFNYRMTDLHAAIGLAQLERLDEFTAKRRANAQFLNTHIESVATPKVRAGYGHVWHQYTIRVDRGRARDAALQQLNDAGIGTGIFYPLPANRQAHMIQLGFGHEHLPEADRAAREVISLPVHPLLSQRDLETIVAAVNHL